MSTAPTPVHRHRAAWDLRLTLTGIGLLLLAAILVTLLVDHVFSSNTTGAGTGSGVAATQVRSVAPFTGVELAGDNNLIIRVGARQSVTVRADSNLLGRVTTRVRTGRLVIGTTPGELNAKTPMSVTIAVPSLDTIVLRGAGNIDVTAVDSRSLAIDLPGSGNVHVTGTTTRLDVMLGGDGNAFLGQLAAADVTAHLSGSGSILLTAARSLDAHISGSGTILYGGSPAHVTTAVSGSGTIRAVGALPPVL